MKLEDFWSRKYPYEKVKLWIAFFSESLFVYRVGITFINLTRVYTAVQEINLVFTCAQE